MENIYEQRDIAPTLAKFLDLPYEVPSGKSIEIKKDLNGQNIILAIIDSFDWAFYESFGKKFLTGAIDTSFLEFKISSEANKTSPAIATILTGLNPEEHCIRSTEDAVSSEVMNLPGFAERNGVESTVVMEARGARTFSKTLKKIFPVEDRDDIIEFDDEIIEGVRKSIAQFDFIVCHLRTVDKFLHQGKELEELKRELEKIIERVVNLARTGNSLLIITGDHKAHGNLFEGKDVLPLLIIEFSKKSKKSARK